MYDGGAARRVRDSQALAPRSSRTLAHRSRFYLKNSINIDKFTGFIGKFPTIDFLWDKAQQPGSAGAFCHGARLPR